MIRVLSSENKLFSLERIFFPEGVPEPNETKVDISRLLRVRKKIPSKCGVTGDTSLTLISALGDDDTMLSAMSKTVRYEVKRCMTSDKVLMKTYFSNDIASDPSILLDFHLVYDHFCDISQQSQLKKDYHFKRIQDYVENDCLFVSAVEYENGKACHMYVVDGMKALLIYSVSDFRNPQVDRNLAARANKYLHFSDMRTLRDAGYIEYDWGNVSSFTAPNGIDIFKAGFGGSPKEVYNYFVGNTWKGKLLIETRKLFNRIK